MIIKQACPLLISVMNCGFIYSLRIHFKLLAFNYNVRSLLNMSGQVLFMVGYYSFWRLFQPSQLHSRSKAI